MAFGVSKALPAAGFVHAKKFGEIDPGNFKDKHTVVLVDSVINTGRSIIEFVKPLTKRYPKIRVVVITGVIQADVVDNAGQFAKLVDHGMYVIALRKSDNRFTGRGGTDTGHRLFNTTNLE